MLGKSTEVISITVCTKKFINYIGTLYFKLNTESNSNDVTITLFEKYSLYKF